MTGRFSNHVMSLECSGNHVGLWNGVRPRQRGDSKVSHPDDSRRVNHPARSADAAFAMVSSSQDQPSQLSTGYIEPTVRREFCTTEPIVNRPGSRERNLTTLLTTDDSPCSPSHQGASDNSISFERNLRNYRTPEQYSNTPSHTSEIVSDSRLEVSASESPSRSTSRDSLLPPTWSRAKGGSTRFKLGTSSDRFIVDHQGSNVQQNSLDGSATCWYPQPDRSLTARAPDTFDTDTTNANNSIAHRSSMAFESQNAIEVSASWSFDKMEEHTAHSTVTTERKNLDDDSTIESNALSPNLTPQPGPQQHSHH